MISISFETPAKISLSCSTFLISSCRFPTAALKAPNAVSTWVQVWRFWRPFAFFNKVRCFAFKKNLNFLSSMRSSAILLAHSFYKLSLMSHYWTDDPPKGRDTSLHLVLLYHNTASTTMTVACCKSTSKIKSIDFSIKFFDFESLEEPLIHFCIHRTTRLVCR